MTVDHRSSHPVSAASWAPDSRSFVTSCLDKGTQLIHWSLDRDEADNQLHTWGGGFRAQDCAISPNGEKLVVIDSDKHLYVYNFNTYEEEYRFTFPCKSTSVTISQDSKFMLVNLTSDEVHLLDIRTANLIRKFEGQKQGQFIIRSSFGGADENFIVSGSEDSKIYIWHRGNGVLVDTLQGHGGGCVNAVAWNPVDPGMFASAGDDRRVRIWSNTVPPNDAIPSAGERRPASNHSYTRTSALRSTFVGESNL